MDYNPESLRHYGERLRSVGLLPEDAVIVGVEDGSSDYRQSGQVFWWTVGIRLSSGETRRYIMKAPHDTFGDGIPLFVERRVELSKRLRGAGISVPKSGVYDKGTLVEEYVDGTRLDVALRTATPEQRQSLLEQRANIVKRSEEVGLVFMDKHDGNFLVDKEGKVVLIDLDFNQRHQ